MQHPIGTMTLAQIKACQPCQAQWKRALACFQKKPAMSTRISLGDIAARMDAETAWWCARALDWSDIAVRRAAMTALLPGVKRAASHSQDARVHDCVAALERWIAGDDTVDLRSAAWAAWAAAWAEAEREAQKQDLIAAFPPLHKKEGAAPE